MEPNSWLCTGQPWITTYHKCPGLAITTWCRKSSSTSAHMQEQFLEGAVKACLISPGCWLLPAWFGVWGPFTELGWCTVPRNRRGSVSLPVERQTAQVRTSWFSCASSCQHSWKHQISFWVSCADQINGVRRWRETWPEESWGPFFTLLQAATKSQPGHWEVFKPLSLAATGVWRQSKH